MSGPARVQERFLREGDVVIMAGGVSRREDPAAGVFAEELRQLRQARGLSQADLGELVNFSASQVGMVEAGRRIPSLDFARRADEVLGTVGTLGRLAEMLRTAPFVSWFRPYAALELEALKIRSWQGSVVDGLLQTRAYAEAVLGVRLGTSDDLIEEQVTARMARQDVLSRPDPPLVWVILDECVLRRSVGGREVMRDQVEHLIAQAGTRNVVVQVLPLAVGGHVGLDGSFAIAEFAVGPAVAYAETAVKGLVVERAEDVAALEISYDCLRAEALPRAASTQLMKEVCKELWTI